MKIFEPAKIGSILLKNRIIRSATYEGMANALGYPQNGYKELYVRLARNNIGGIITGFHYINKEGKAMQQYQSGIDTVEKIAFLKEVTDKVHTYDCKIFMQLAHAGRQTRQKETGLPVLGVSNKKSHYFGEIPQVLTTEQVFKIIDQFARSVVFAQEAGFDGVQLHAAHGYLIHQFLLPTINNRNDIFKIETDTRIGTKFLELVIAKIKEKCGESFPILVKISGSDDNLFVNLIRFLDSQKVNAIEISYGTMDEAVNIFRGNIPIDLILQFNPVYKTNKRLIKWLSKKVIFPILLSKIKSFSPMYNLKYAKRAKQITTVPIICVGGIRKGDEIKWIIENENIDFVSMSRPFICEPDFVNKLLANKDYISRCKNCNYCAVMCDSGNPTHCCQKETAE